MLVNDVVWPYVRKQIGFADHLAGPRHEQGQNIETPTAECDGLPLVQKGLGLWQQPEIAELVGILLRPSTGPAVVRHFALTIIKTRRH
jgi:hypothetical protein